MRINRKRWALSQRELGQLLGGISRQTVGKFELGRRTPSLRMVLRYQVIFGADPADILPALYEELEEEVLEGATRLSVDLDGRGDGASLLKRRLLSSIATRAGARRLRV